MDVDAPLLDPHAAPDRAVIEDVLARAGLSHGGEPRGALADDAVWLALMALGGRARPALDRLRAGTFWTARDDDADEASCAGSPEQRDDASRVRVALALILREHAADRETGAAERAVSTLACVALGCADADAGRVLQQGLAQLELLDIVRQIPVAARVRALALEFRFRRLEALPARFVARVQDLLERLDREALLAVALRDRAAPEERARTLRHVALAGGDPRLGALLEALIDAGRPVAARELARVWGPSADARQVGTACGRLAKALDGGPWRLRKAQGLWTLQENGEPGTGNREPGSKKKKQTRSGRPSGR